MTELVLAGPLDWLWSVLGWSRSPRLCEWCLEQLHGEPVRYGWGQASMLHVEDSLPGKRRQFFHIGCHMRWQHCRGVKSPQVVRLAEAQTLANKVLHPPGPQIEIVRGGF